MVPGDPVTVIMRENGAPAQMQAVRERLGLDRPVLVQ